ncbi:MAG: matrixin family metalloprotease [Planctomycetes bacterium]|nr:matrixin family metalloprotease [Planctomycetota bacterium]
MKTRTKRLLGLQAAAVVAAVIFVAPSTLIGFALIGGSLGVGSGGNGYQRDVRVDNNFGDVSANDNQTVNSSFPGALGAPLAIWKAAKEWGSDTVGVQKNFDFDWQGSATTAGSTNDNTVSEQPTSCGGGGVLAFTETPIADGWRMILCPEWTWDDGPGTVPSNRIDIQGVCAHELGHSLGLGHSNVGCGSSSQAIMCPAIFGTGTSARTVKADDIAGLNAIYGGIPASKPLITSLGGSTTQGQTLIINGSNFAATVNVKFTAGTTANTGSIPGVVFSVPSANGGTQVSVTVPANARPGNVFVWEPALGLLSNGFPIAVGSQPPTLSMLAPNSGPLRGGNQVDLTGTNFSDVATVTFGGVAASVLTRTGSTGITVFAPPGPGENQAVDVQVSQPSGTATLTGGYTYTANPAEVAITSGTTTIGTTVTFTVYGPVNKRAALAVGPLGTFFHAGTGLTFCWHTPLRARWNFNQLNLGALGQASVTWVVAGEALEHVNAQGVVQIVAGSQFEQTNCLQMSLFP